MFELTDVHCHLMPYVDDGAEDSKAAYQLLQAEYAQGVRRIILTPHYRKGMFESPMQLLEKQYRLILRMAAQISEDLEIYMGCEFHTHPKMAAAMQKGFRPTMAGSAYVLTEFSGRHTFHKIRAQAYDLITAGFMPILAHIERYPYLTEDLAQIDELIRMGACMQVNAGSILGVNGRKTKLLCRKLMQESMIDFVGTDAHDPKVRKPELGKCAEYIEKKMGTDYARELLVNNPNKIIQEGKIGE